MVRIILTLLMALLAAAQAWGATYYVNATSGSDAAAGTTEGAAWKTISKVNASTFAAGDTIYFNKGDTWYEELLIPSSGTSGSVITFTSYGTGNKPIISGALDASSFAVGAPADLTLVDLNGDIEHGDTSHWDVTSLGTGGEIIATDTDKHAGTYSLKMTWGSAGNVRADLTVTLEANTYYQLSFWQKKTANNDAMVLFKNATANTWLQNDLTTWNSNVVALTGITITSADWARVVFVFKTSTAASYTLRFQQSSASTAYLDDVSIKKVQWEQVSGNEYKANVFQNKRLAATRSDFMNYTEDASSLGLAYYGGEPLTIGTAESLNANECGYEATGGTMNVNVGASPSALDIKIPWRGCNIHLNGKDYITIDGLDLRYSAIDDGTNVLGGVCAEDSASTNITIQNCDFTNHLANGIRGDTNGHTSWTITRNSFQNIWNGKAYGSSGAGNAIYINTGMTSAVVSKNAIHDSYVGIRPEGAGAQINYNKLYNIYVNGIDHQTDTSASPVLIYNNTIYHTPPAGWTGGHGIACQAAGHGAKIKNNIVYSNAGAGATNVEALALSNSNTIEIDNNLLFAAGASVYSIMTYSGQIVGGGTPSPAAPTGCAYTSNNLICSTFAGMQAAFVALKDNETIKWTSDGTVGHAAMANGVGTDPLFMGLAAYDFKLGGGSPAINAGTNVSLTSDFDGNPVPRGAAPDIGAYEKSLGGLFTTTNRFNVFAPHRRLH